jgi:hypothetical protein
MTGKRKILFSLSFPALLWAVILFSLINTCQRFEPELFLEISTDSVITLPGREYKLTGSVISFGELPIAQHGFCWAVTSNPTTAGDTTQLGARNSKGVFSSTISGLTSGTKYYVRAYVITSDGTEYGEDRSFTTPAPTLPAVTTTAVSNVTQESAQSGGTITDEGGATVTARGVCWSTSPYPTVSDSRTTDGSGTGSFTSSLTGLTENTTYYVRAYATNSAGTAYGGEVYFKTWEGTLSDYDGNVYRTVQIGSQIWMAENLKVTHYASGISIPLVENAAAWEAIGYKDKA